MYLCYGAMPKCTILGVTAPANALDDVLLFYDVLACLSSASDGSSVGPSIWILDISLRRGIRKGSNDGASSLAKISSFMDERANSSTTSHDMVLFLQEEAQNKFGLQLVQTNGKKIV